VRYSNKVVIVTGASSGIGRCAAIEFAKEGASVAVVARRHEQGLETVELIKAAGGQAIYIQADLSIASQVKEMVDTVIKQFGRLDCAFNNAGIAEPISNTVDLSEEDFDRVINTNLKAAWLCMKYQIPAMLISGGGAIVNMSSVWGVLATSMGVPAYVASKHGVIGLSKAAALEFGSKGIRVNSISPAWVPTEANAPVLDNPAIHSMILGQHPIGRLGTTVDVANAVKWLCSDEASWYTAQNLVLDGGYSAQ
jgi:NAD(P)-dependent dehydrogenase (short-subunit alcohol dehydrogenase family)